MVSIKTVVEGLETQFDAAIAGECEPAQVNMVCKIVDTYIKLARLQIEMGAIDWSASSEAPVIEMESSVPVLKKIASSSPQVKPTPVQPNAKNEEKIKPPVTAKTSQGQDIERQIHVMQAKLATLTDKEAAIMVDRIELSRNKLKRLEPDWKG